MPTLPLCGGIMPQVGEAGKRILPLEGDPFLPVLLTEKCHPCNVRRHTMPKPVAHLIFILNYWEWRLLQRVFIDQISSARPIRNPAKHSANTEWLRLAPKYCQKAAPAPG